MKMSVSAVEAAATVFWGKRFVLFTIHLQNVNCVQNGDESELATQASI
jgi:hypothetical protein